MTGQLWPSGTRHCATASISAAAALSCDAKKSKVMCSSKPNGTNEIANVAKAQSSNEHWICDVNMSGSIRMHPYVATCKSTAKVRECVSASAYVHIGTL